MTHARSAPPDDRVAAGFPLSDGPLSDIAEQMKNGQLDAVPAPVFSFNDIREAHRVMEAGEAGGKCRTGLITAQLRVLSTVSFLFTTPGVGEPAGGGFPAISLTGEFLLKDIPLLGLSFWTLAEAIRAIKRPTTVSAE